MLQTRNSCLLLLSLGIVELRSISAESQVHLYLTALHDNLVGFFSCWFLKKLMMKLWMINRPV